MKGKNKIQDRKFIWYVSTPTEVFSNHDKWSEQTVKMTPCDQYQQHGNIIRSVAIRLKERENPVLQNNFYHIMQMELSVLFVPVLDFPRLSLLSTYLSLWEIA